MSIKYSVRLTVGDGMIIIEYVTAGCDIQKVGRMSEGFSGASGDGFTEFPQQTHFSRRAKSNFHL